MTAYTITSTPGKLAATATGGKTSATVSGLTNGTSYVFTVVAMNKVGKGPSSLPSNPVTPLAVPDPPTAVTASAGDAQATVSWKAPDKQGGSAITTYTVTSSPGGLTATVDAPATTATVFNLTNGTSYTFAVVATNSVGNSLPSAPSAAVTPATAPDSPTGVSATASDAQAIVTWSTPTNDGGSAITGYTVTSTPNGITATAGGDATTATVTGLTNGTTYIFTVVATNAVGSSAPSLPPNPVTPMVVPGAPTDVTAVAGNAEATVSWTAPTDTGGSGLLVYTVFSNPDGLTAVAAAPQISASVAGLTNGTRYTFTVIATNSAGNSVTSSPSNSVTPANVPDAPTGVTAQVTAARGWDVTFQATVHWIPPGNDGGSTITGYTVTSSPTGLTATVGGSATSAQMNDLSCSNSTAYTFTVVATNAIGNSGASQPSNSWCESPVCIGNGQTGQCCVSGGNCQ